MRLIYDEQGEDYLTHIRQWIREFREFEEEAVLQGYTPEEAKQLANRWRPLPPGSATSTTQQKGAMPAEPIEAEDSPEDATEDSTESDNNNAQNDSNS